jgi:hypothetical protein
VVAGGLSHVRIAQRCSRGSLISGATAPLDARRLVRVAPGSVPVEAAAEIRIQVGAALQQFALMNAILAELSGTPLLKRCATIGAASGGVVGAIVGLIVGLLANPATAWFAIFELGIPAAIAGWLVGSIAALTVTATRRIKHSSPPCP